MEINLAKVEKEGEVGDGKEDTSLGGRRDS